MIANFQQIKKKLINDDTNAIFKYSLAVARHFNLILSQFVSMSPMQTRTKTKNIHTLQLKNHNSLLFMAKALCYVPDNNDDDKLHTKLTHGCE